MTIREAAQIAGVTEFAVRKAIHRGTLKAKPFRMIPREITRPEFDKWMRNRGERTAVGVK